MKITVRKLPLRLDPNPRRVLIRPFIPKSTHHIEHILSRLLSLEDSEVKSLLQEVMNKFSYRHKNIIQIFIKHFQTVKPYIPSDKDLSEERKILIGAYFTHEYSLESTGMLNPSIVMHPHQDKSDQGLVRVILSLRAIGEGHVSSIVFREGYIDKDYNIHIVEPTPFVVEPERIPNPYYDKSLFKKKLFELDGLNEISSAILDNLPVQFSLEELEKSINHYVRNRTSNVNLYETINLMRNLALSNYEVHFSKDEPVSEKVVFPTSPTQINGIEDARFVRFTDDDGSVKYYATYTAYDGRIIMPQLLETDDFIHFKFVTLNGPSAKNKGMALFPRKINGCYAMLGRHDNENLYLMYSENIHFWFDSIKIVQPTYHWELVQIGNCGSPIELSEGWLVLTHGVGAMRRYSLGAILLDKNDPTKVIGRLKEPLLEPAEDEREGYVPNVLYTCGAMVINDKLFLPYAISDFATKFAIVELKELLNAMY